MHNYFKKSIFETKSIYQKHNLGLREKKSASKKPLWLKVTGLISFFMFFMVKKALFFYLYMSRSGAKKV